MMCIELVCILSIEFEELVDLPAESVACCVLLPLTEVTVLFGDSWVLQDVRVLKQLWLLCAAFVEPGLLVGQPVCDAHHSLFMKCLR